MAGRSSTRGNQDYQLLANEVFQDNVSGIMSVLNNIRRKAPVHTDEELEKRTGQYFAACADTSTLPDLASLALALGVSKHTLEGWARGVNCTADRQEVIQRAYTTIEAAQIQATARGNFNPILFMFLAKSKYGYREDGSVAGFGDRAIIEAGASASEIEKRYNTPLPVTLASLETHAAVPTDDITDMTSKAVEADIIDDDDDDGDDEYDEEDG